VATVFPATNTITLKQTNPIQENYNHRITLLEADKKSISFYILKMFFKKIIFLFFILNYFLFLICFDILILKIIKYFFNIFSNKK